MSEPARNRFALDLDDLERQLRGAAQAPRPGAAADPLAELTRIVNQDDPLKELFAHRGGQAPVRAAEPPAWPTAQQEPAYAPVSVQRAAAEVSAPPADIRGALDEFEALLRRTEPPREAAPAAFQQPMERTEPPVDDYDQPEPYQYARPQPPALPPHAARDLDQDETGAYRDDYDYHQPQAAYAGQQASYPEPKAYAEPEQGQDEDTRDLERPRSRKGLWTAAALIAVAVIGVAGAMTFRGGAPVGKDGQPPVISAAGGPTKVEPVNPGGAEIPNQNKQIYERAGEAAPAGQTKVVSREEQPVDVQQAARSMPPRAIMPGPGSGPVAMIQGNGAAATNPLAQAPAAVPAQPGTTPAEPALTPMPAVPGLGEPRRVRTVSIRPDGAPAPSPSVGTAYANGTLPSATGSVPALAGNPAPNPATTASTGARPRSVAATPEPPKAQERIAAPPAATTPAAPVRVANVPPPQQNTPSPAAAIRGGSGDFAVQLAAPGSEAEARATFSALQRKYPDQLGGKAPIVRKTELAGGKTVYRLRVGPYSRDDATTVCTALQSAGGQCFIAKN